MLSQNSIQRYPEPNSISEIHITTMSQLDSYGSQDSKGEFLQISTFWCTVLQLQAVCTPPKTSH